MSTSVTVIAHELRGFLPVGGMGTATTYLALALARMGNSVEILLGKHAHGSIDPAWDAAYREAGVPIRPVPQSEETVQPWQFEYPHNVALALQADPPDVVIAHDFGAPAYAALHLRQAGVAFEDSLFVVFCHGPRRYVADLSPTIPLGDLQTVLGVSLLEQACVELADVVVSPSAYLLDWMRGRGWKLPERTAVIPYFTRADATGEPVPPAPRPVPDPIKRFAFFGRVDEKKGLRPFAAALNALEPESLRGLEVEFVGKTTRTWTRDRTEALLSETTRSALARVTFETELDQQQALARLSQPGTLVVMPSLQENSPNTVYECLERGIPFIASNVGGVPELIAPEDHARVLFEATASGVEAALRRVLAEGMVPAPVRPAFASSVSSGRWAEVITMRPGAQTEWSDADERVDVIVGQSAPRDATAPYVILLDEEDVPNPALVETLLRVRAAAQADVVTCGLRLERDDGTLALQFFSGDAGGLGALSNAYGNVALIRRSLLDDLDVAPGVRDPDWPLLARLARSGAKIVSVPLALVERRATPGSADDDPAGALLAIQELEQALPDQLRGAARLAAGLAAQNP
jgi:glycosyltransferase involved in cell wall biosynthesis